MIANGNFTIAIANIKNNPKLITKELIIYSPIDITPSYIIKPESPLDTNALTTAAAKIYPVIVNRTLIP